MDFLWSPTIRDTFLGVPAMRTTIFWGQYWGLPFFGKPLNLRTAYRVWDVGFLGLRAKVYWAGDVGFRV